jgi:hypothetical protein
MVQSDVPRGRTQSGKINARWYLQRLKASAKKPNLYLNNSLDNQIYLNKNDSIRVVRGTTATQGQHIPRVFLRSPTRTSQTDLNQQVLLFILFYFIFNQNQI